jgi:hypothetical protein
METQDFLGLECVEISNKHLTLLVTRSVGPRIISLRVDQGENIFAELPDLTLEYPGEGEYHVYGGHRMWHAPEDPIRTYIPDDQQVDIVLNSDGATIEQPVEENTGLQKKFDIKFIPDVSAVSIKHTIKNWGMWPVTCAPWAITQFKMGGVAILPQNNIPVGNGLRLPNRMVSLWPYTDPSIKSIIWGKEHIKVLANLKDGALKLGFPNRCGWLAYWRENTLFVKRANYFHDRDYFDYGSSSECYCNSQFLELETVGPISVVEPEGVVEHLEIWELYSNTPWTDDISGLIRMIEEKSLEDYI